MYKSTGFISFLLRRVTGVALVLYLFVHMWVIGSVNSGPAAFDARLNLVQTPFFKLAEIALLAAVVYHAFDGLRLIIVHYFEVTEYRKSLFYAIFAVSVILVIAGGIPILLFALEG
jgi:succinate dehydrogenase / fumarate reductase cytochrome b subunit